jgi:hypothetical protein
MISVCKPKHRAPLVHLAVALLGLTMIIGYDSRAIAAHGSWMHPG